MGSSSAFAKMVKESIRMGYMQLTSGDIGRELRGKTEAAELSWSDFGVSEKQYVFDLKQEPFINVIFSPCMQGLDFIAGKQHPFLL